MLIGFPKKLSGMLDCRLAIEKTNHEWAISDPFPGNIIGNDRLLMSSPDIESETAHFRLVLRTSHYQSGKPIMNQGFLFRVVDF